MISVIIASRNEPKTIGKCIKCIADKEYSGITDPFEIIQASPDKETLDAGLTTSKELKLSSNQYIQIKDPKKGKPYALDLALKKSKGSILIFTDGDTYLEKNAIKYLLKPFSNEGVGGTTGRTVSMDSKNTLMGYWGHLLADAAHHRRMTVMSTKKDDYHISGKEFFPMSGYIMATRNYDFEIPSNVLSDDAYISYFIRNLGKEIAYTPNAICYVKYPRTLNDYYKQKVRSLGGYIQLQSLGVFKRDKQSRSLGIEMKYTLFVLKYPKNLKQFLWSLLLFPIRVITWLKIFWQRVILKKDMPKSGWERIESTK